MPSIKNPLVVMNTNGGVPPHGGIDEYIKTAEINNNTLVLTDQDDETIEYTPQEPTIDQTYDSESANAQSGVALAGPLANKVTKSGMIGEVPLNLFRVQRKMK